MFLLDTDTASAIIRDRALIGKSVKLLTEGEWGISSITLMEIEFGKNTLASNDRRRALIDRFVRLVNVFEFDAVAAQEAANIRAELKRVGKPIGAYDPLIAGHAIALGAILVTGNTKHFTRVKNLRIDNWLK